jgi:hypothetical protein
MSSDIRQSIDRIVRIYSHFYPEHAEMVTAHSQLLLSGTTEAELAALLRRHMRDSSPCSPQELYGRLLQNDIESIVQFIQTFIETFDMARIPTAHVESIRKECLRVMYTLKEGS